MAPYKEDGRAAIISSVVGAVVLGLWYLTTVIPEWQYQNRPPDAGFQEGNIAMVMVSLFLLAAGLASSVITLSLAVAALVKRAWASAAIAVAILVVTIAGYFIGFSLI